MRCENIPEKGGLYLPSPYSRSVTDEQLVSKVVKNATDSVIDHDRVKARDILCIMRRNPDSRGHEELSPTSEQALILG